MDPVTLSLLAAGISGGSSILGGLFGSNAAKAAAEQQQAAIVQAQQNAQQGTAAAVQGIGAQQPFWDKGYGAQQNAMAAARADLTGASNGYNPYAKQGKVAWQQLGNATGVNGMANQKDYAASFQTDPGFQAAQDYGMQGLQRSAAARGALDSGGAAKELYQYGQQGLLGQYNQRVQQLKDQANMGYSATGAQAGVANTMANLDQTGGQIANTYYDKSASIPAQQGQVQQQGYNQMADYAIGTGNAQAQGTQNVANARINAMSGVGKAAAGFAGYAGGAQPIAGYGSTQAGWQPAVFRGQGNMVY